MAIGSTMGGAPIFDMGFLAPGSAQSPTPHPPPVTPPHPPPDPDRAPPVTEPPEPVPVPPVEPPPAPVNDPPPGRAALRTGSVPLGGRVQSAVNSRPRDGVL
jgi:hypothetical protein